MIFIAAFWSRSIVNPQNGQQWTRSDNSFLTIWLHREHNWVVLLGVLSNLREVRFSLRWRYMYHLPTTWQNQKLQQFQSEYTGKSGAGIRIPGSGPAGLQKIFLQTTNKKNKILRDLTKYSTMNCVFLSKSVALWTRPIEVIFIRQIRDGSHSWFSYI